MTLEQSRMGLGKAGLGAGEVLQGARRKERRGWQSTKRGGHGAVWCTEMGERKMGWSGLEVDRFGTIVGRNDVWQDGDPLEGGGVG